MEFHSNTTTTVVLEPSTYNSICSRLAQLALRKGDNCYADSLAHSQAEPQTHRCLGWRDREVVVRDVEPNNVETTFGVNYVGDATSPALGKYKNDFGQVFMTLKFPGYTSVTLYLTDTDGAVMRYAGNFSAVNDFSFFGGNDFGGNGNTKICQ